MQVKGHNWFLSCPTPCPYLFYLCLFSDSHVMAVSLPCPPLLPESDRAGLLVLRWYPPDWRKHGLSRLGILAFLSVPSLMKYCVISPMRKYPWGGVCEWTKGLPACVHYFSDFSSERTMIRRYSGFPTQSGSDLSIPVSQMYSHVLNARQFISPGKWIDPTLVSSYDWLEPCERFDWPELWCCWLLGHRVVPPIWTSSY